MSATGYESDEDDQPKTFELIEVFMKGEDREEYEPLGLLYRDPRVQVNGGKFSEATHKHTTIVFEKKEFSYLKIPKIYHL